MAVLSLLFSHPDESFYVRQIVRLTGAGMGAVQRELKRFSESGVIRREVRGSQVYYQAAPTCPIYEEIRSLIVKTAGVADVIRAALTNLTNRIDLAFLYGSIARGQETKNSDADILVIGDITFGELVEALNPAQDQIGREINPTVYPLPEFRSGLKSGNHFLTTVMNGKKIFLYGEPNELTKLVE